MMAVLHHAEDAADLIDHRLEIVTEQETAHVAE
jgi:hypothetical protein